VTHALDERDDILRLVSEYLPIRIVRRTDNDILVTTETGVTLFETKPRSISLQHGPVDSAPSVIVDGLRVTGDQGAFIVADGKLTTLSNLNNGPLRNTASALDAISQQLIKVFAETDTTQPPPANKRAGLFVEHGTNDVPASSAQARNLASRLRVNPLHDPNQGGSAEYVRDAGTYGATTLENNAGLPGFQARLSRIRRDIETPDTLIGAHGNPVTATASQVSFELSGRIAQDRKNNDDASTQVAAVVERVSQALQRDIGISIDDEMSTLLTLEKAFQANARVLSTINTLYDTLLTVAA
jgi:flagellar hook-associated protein 1